MEHWAAKKDLGPLQWREGSFGVLMASLGSDPSDIYTIVPLDVHPDSKPEL